MVDLDALVPKDHLLRKIERVMDYDWLYERLGPYYRWFLGYNLLDEIPHFATVSYAFCKRFPEELAAEIFEHILNKALNNKMVDPSTI